MSLFCECMAQVGRAVSERIVQDVAKSANRDALELPPLYGAVDPDALDRLVTEMADGEVSFTYAEHEITVTSGGTIHVDELSAGYSTDERAVND